MTIMTIPANVANAAEWCAGLSRDFANMSARLTAALAAVKEAEEALEQRQSAVQAEIAARI